jgi:hypothetical protein
LGNLTGKKNRDPLELHVLVFNHLNRRSRPFFDLNVDPLCTSVAEVISCQSWPNSDGRNFGNFDDLPI